MKIEQNRIVSLSYDLQSEGKLIESVTDERPMEFMYGVGYLLPKFEEQIKDLCVGDPFDFVLAAKDAYGEWDERAIMELPKNIFETDGVFDHESVTVGRTLPMQDSDGNRMYGTVDAVNKDSVTMNFNHQLAGQNLHFAGKVVAIREVTPEDLSGGCGCDGGCGCHDGDNDDCGCGCDCGDKGGCCC